MTTSRDLAAARFAQNDEFYTCLGDIENELKHYSKHFGGKTVYCNCDDPLRSNFFKYFVLNFNKLGLKKLVATCFAATKTPNQQIPLFEVPGQHQNVIKNEHAWFSTVTTVDDSMFTKLPKASTNVDKPVRKNAKNLRTAGDNIQLNFEKIFSTYGNSLKELDGDGGFRSPECLKILDAMDVVVTNPPFSIFGSFVDTMYAHDKKFVIWGNTNAVTYKEVFPRFFNGILWGGFLFNKSCVFQIPDIYEKHDEKLSEKIGDGGRYCRVPSIATFTNLEIEKRHQLLKLTKKYSPEEYPQYDNYDAIEVAKTADIPRDYPGIIGVPITFLGKWNPDQFELLGSQRWCKTEEVLAAHKSGNREAAMNDKKIFVNGEELYARLFIRNKGLTVDK